MANSPFGPEYLLHFPADAHIVNILSYVDKMGFSPSSCKILSSNLKIMIELNLSVSCSEKLSDFLQKYLKTIENREDARVFDGNEIQQMIVSILNLLERDKKLPIMKFLLHHLLDTAEDLLNRLNSEYDVSRDVILRMRLLNLLLTYIGENKLNEIFSQEMYSRFDKFFIRLFVKEDERFLPQVLSLSLIYMEVTGRWMLFQEVLVRITDRCLSSDDSVEVFVKITSFFVDSSIKANRFTSILELDKFWRALKKCFTYEKCVRKHVSHLLKFAISNLHNKTVEGVWNSQHDKNYHSWWRNYFIIFEILEEKQTHLVLPVFPMISDLLDDAVVQVDAFWILILFQSALEHDSRTIRLKAFLLFLNAGRNLYQVVHFPILLKLFVNTANDSALYRKLFKANEFDEYGNSVIAWINFFAGKDGPYFFEVLFSTICGVKWSPIPLYYILDIFNRSGIQPCLKIEVTDQLKNTISNVTRYHHIVIRAAIQCSFIKFFTMICRCDSEDLTYLFDFVNLFNEEECLLRGVAAWSVLTDYLIHSATYHSAEKFISEMITSQIECDRRSSNRIVLPLARFILLLHDSFNILDRESCLCSRLENMVLSFSSALQNPYSSIRVQDNYLLLLVGIYSYSRNNAQVGSYMPIPNIVTCIEENSFAIFSYIIQRMTKSEDNAELLDFYEFCLKKLSNSGTSFLKNINSVSVLNDWWNKALERWHTRKDLSAYCSAKIVLWILDIQGNNSSYRVKRVDNINPVFKSFIDGEQPSFDSMNSGVSNMTSNYANTMWSILELSLKTNFTIFFEYVEIPIIFDFVLNTFDWVRKENLFLVLKTLKHLLSSEITLKHEQMVLQLMDDSWKRVEEIHSTPYYNDCLKYWIEAFLQKSVLQVQTYHTKIEQYVNILIEMVAENGGQCFRYIIFALNEFEYVENLFALFPQASDILIKIYCVTHADREDQKMESRTEEHIRWKLNEVSVNQIKKFDVDFSSEIMRLKALNIILKLSQTENNCLSICLRHCRSLIAVDKNFKKRYFNDSVIHRIKHKKLQLLLIIETIASQKISYFNLNSLELPKLVYDFAVSSLLTEPHQPSVRYMLEWLIIRLILHYPDFFFEKFWNSFSEASEERIGSICSFISVAFHISNVSKNETFVNLAVKSILPWAMGQHFNARLYAQTVLVKLINTSDVLKNRYEVVEESLNNCLRRGNAVKNSIKLQQDFYFRHFHPLNHFSLLMILWDLPRLSGICREEWLPKDLYVKYLHVESDGVIPFYHQPDLFCSFTSSSWIAKATLTNNYSEHEAISDADVSLAYPTETQKKFIPVETISNFEISSLPKNAQKLVVVASLIDRAPNLGGLTRTCEVFAVSQLVINNLDITRSKEFTSLSITAEKHVDLVEVKRQNLCDYLRKLREDEFCIVGVEQTTNSKKLEDFVFPVKSVLVLGNEKEGIPAGLLPFLDVCVEIPQSGVIRSLNVHVSASIIIWEYSKQHLLNPN